MEKTARQKTYDQISEMTQPEITELVLDLREQIERWKLRVDVLTDLSEVSRLEGLNLELVAEIKTMLHAIDFAPSDWIPTQSVYESAQRLTALLSRASSKEETTTLKYEP